MRREGACAWRTDRRYLAHALRSRPARSGVWRLPKQSRRDRKKVEILFAHLKRILKLDRLRLRGLTGAHDEFLLAATAQNIRRMAKRLFEGQQSTTVMPA